MSFTHLHVHTEYSLLDGAIRVPDLCKQVAALGQSSVAVTDHGVLFGAVKFTKEAKEYGIKPIIGFEGYVATDTINKPASSSGDNYHITILAATREGYGNLMRLTSHGHLRGLSYKPRVDHRLLEAHSAGLIVLSGCIGAQIPSLILSDRLSEAESLARWFREKFEGRFFIEVMAHGSTGGVDHVIDRVSGKSETWLNDELVGLANRLGVGVVATNDAHYLERAHGNHHDTLLCIGMGKYKEEADRLRFPGAKEKAYEFYIKSKAEMLEASDAEWWSTAVSNASLVADLVENDVVPLGNQVMPRFTIPDDPAFRVYQRTGLLI